MTTSSNPLLVGSNLCKDYRGRRILDNVSFEISVGEIVGLLGPNGAGKTTSFYVLAGLVRPTEGKIAYDGKDITNLPVDQRAKLGIGFLPQERSVFRMLSVYENVKAVLEIGGENSADMDERSTAILSKMGIEHLAEESVDKLSGGETRRVEISRALALRPKILMLDEPFAAIDPLTVADLQKMLRKLKESGISLVISDHNVRETLAICDRAYILHDGTTLCGGTPAEIATNEKVRTHYLGEDFRL